MPAPIVVTETVRIPARALTVRAVRASGPGGQRVNKAATKVLLRVAVDEIAGLSEAARARLRRLAGRRLDAAGGLVVVSQATRDQARNLADARRRLCALVAAALREPPVRRPTRPGPAAREARLAAKRRRAALKRARARPPVD
jgi:ribosome-associated protein